MPKPIDPQPNPVIADSVLPRRTVCVYDGSYESKVELPELDSGGVPEIKESAGANDSKVPKELVDIERAILQEIRTWESEGGSL